MKKSPAQIFFIFLFFPGMLLSATSHADFPRSGEQRSSFATEAAIGFDEAKSHISGFYHFKQVQMENHSFHADCTILFSGTFTAKKVIPIVATDVAAKKIIFVKGNLEFRGYANVAPGNPNEEIFTLRLYENLPSCSDAVDVSTFDMDIEIERFDKWKMVSAVRSKRAYFYSEPDEISKGKAFLVAGDVIRIYEENENWYYVKYQNGKKETAGWIKKSDTIQLTDHH